MNFAETSPPYRDPIVNKDGYITPSWSRWFSTYLQPVVSILLNDTSLLDTNLPIGDQSILNLLIKLQAEFSQSVQDQTLVSELTKLQAEVSALSIQVSQTTMNENEKHDIINAQVDADQLEMVKRMAWDAIVAHSMGGY